MKTLQTIVNNYLQESQDIIQKFVSVHSNAELIGKAGEIMAEAIQKGGKVISCGNGGSMSDAMHFAEELSGRFRHNRKALPAIAISDPAFISCAANDFGYDFVFSRYIEAMGKPGDVLLAISTSGNSPNITEAVKAAKTRQMKVIALTGKTGGILSGLCDIEIRAPKTEFSDHAQEIHIMVIHSLVLCIEKKLIG